MNKIFNVIVALMLCVSVMQASEIEWGGMDIHKFSPEFKQKNREWLIESVKEGALNHVETALRLGAPADTKEEGVPLVVIAARLATKQHDEPYEFITRILLEHGGAEGLTADQILKQVPGANLYLRQLIMSFAGTEEQKKGLRGL